MGCLQRQAHPGVKGAAPANLYGTERWRIDEEELQDFLDFDYEEYDDETGEGPPEDEADSRDLEMVVPPLADELYSPSIAPDDVAAEQAPVQAHEVPIDDKSESMPIAQFERQHTTTS